MSTASTTNPAAASELVPIADRLRYLQAFRFLLAAVVGFAAWVERDSLTADAKALAIVTAAYLVSRGLAKSGSREPYFSGGTNANRGSDGSR